jgi:hypothetical protein
MEKNLLLVLLPLPGSLLTTVALVGLLAPVGAAAVVGSVGAIVGMSVRNAIHNTAQQNNDGVAPLIPNQKSKTLVAGFTSPSICHH